jgi:hypothetical protein
MKRKVYEFLGYRIDAGKVIGIGPLTRTDGQNELGSWMEMSFVVFLTSYPFRFETARFSALNSTPEQRKKDMTVFKNDYWRLHRQLQEARRGIIYRTMMGFRIWLLGEKTAALFSGSAVQKGEEA